MIFMVKIGNNKFRTYKRSEYAVAVADARDYGSIVESYRILSDGRFAKLSVLKGVKK
jgi:hypothetical protein